jgi:Ca2+-binding RTX toxin-like protein
LFGDNGANVLSGSGGDDVLLGFGGNDLLVGDIRNFPSGNDSLNGGDGNDILNGGKGVDSLTGGADADTFVWYSADESPGMNASGQNDLANTDVILDFNYAEGDRINVRSVDSVTEVPGNQIGFDFIGEHNTVGGFTAPGQVAYFIAGGDTYLIFNTDTTFHTESDTDFEFAIKIAGVQTPNDDWFVHGGFV